MFCSKCFPGSKQLVLYLWSLTFKDLICVHPNKKRCLKIFKDDANCIASVVFVVGHIGIKIQAKQVIILNLSYLIHYSNDAECLG